MHDIGDIPRHCQLDLGAVRRRGFVCWASLDVALDHLPGAPTAEPRFGLLETVREFAQGLLALLRGREMM